MADEVAHWSPITLLETLVRIGTLVVRHGRYIILQVAEERCQGSAAAEILRRIDRL